VKKFLNDRQNVGMGRYGDRSLSDELNTRCRAVVTATSTKDSSTNNFDKLIVLSAI
jgi:hypothetical protein